MTSSLLWTLITLQIAMGAFDMFFHHELTERLAWRPSQARELRLHGARNLIYGLLFLILGWTELHGLLAWALIAILGAEIVITLMDFVEEDRSRKLPATERVTHALLALNYGAILALAIPVLIAWGRQPLAVVAAFHGLWSVLAAVSAAGVAIFGVRDLAAAHRARRLVGPDPATLVAALGARRTILITGATGFIGQRLTAALTGAGHHVIALLRDPAKAAMLGAPLTIVTALAQIPDDMKIDAIVNLAGEPIANGLWTTAKRARIVQSRVGVTRDLVDLIARLTHRPEILVSGSAIGWYGLRQDEALTESDAGQDCFSHAVCAAWEAAARPAAAYGVRLVYLRIGLVLGSEGGLLGRMLTPFEFGLGGPLGSGRQWMSWIARDDLVRLIAHAIAEPNLSGPLNATAPMPVTNAGFTRALGRGLHRPAFLRAPASLLGLTGDFGHELLLGGQRILPDKALKSGFVFRHSTVESAFQDILGAG